MTPKLQPFILSELDCTFWIAKHHGRLRDRRVLVVRFEGTYRSGSMGNPDAAFMRSLTEAGIESIHPHAVIVDFADLDYHWGDGLDCTLGVEVPVALIVGPNCRKAIGTLWFGLNSMRDPCEEEWVFDTLDDAWAFITKSLNDDEKYPTG